MLRKIVAPNLFAFPAAFRSNTDEPFNFSGKSIGKKQ